MTLTIFNQHAKQKKKKLSLKIISVVYFILSLYKTRGTYG